MFFDGYPGDVLRFRCQPGSDTRFNFTGATPLPKCVEKVQCGGLPGNNNYIMHTIPYRFGLAVPCAFSFASQVCNGKHSIVSSPLPRP